LPNTNQPLLVYVAGPYTPSNRDADIDTQMREVEANVRRAVRAGEEVIRRGHVPFIPHTHTNSFAFRTVLPQSTELYYVWDRSILARCDVIYRFARSPGADREWDWAKELGLIRVTTVDRLPRLEPWTKRLKEELD